MPILLSRWKHFILLFGSLVAILLVKDRIVQFLSGKLQGLSDQKGSEFYFDLSTLIVNELFWLFFFLLLVKALYEFFARQSSVDKLTLWADKKVRWIFFIIMFALVASVCIAKFILLEFPNSSDEYVYIFQAESLSRAEIASTPHPLYEFFTFNHLFQNEDVWIGRFPPGWPLILSYAFLTKLPLYLINPILGALTLWVFFLFARYKYDVHMAWWSVITLGLSSFFLFNSASFFSHALTMLCSVLFAFFLLKYVDTQRFKFALLAGFFIGLSFVTRYYTAILISLPFILYLYPKGWTFIFKALGITVIGFLPWLLFFLLYNHYTTGNPLLPVTVWVDPEEGLGFVKGHTVLQGFEHIVRRLLLFVYWTSPGLLILFVWFSVKKLSRKSEIFSNPEDWTFLLLIVGYFFYHEIGGNQYGPRFYYEAFPFLIVFVISQVMKQNQTAVIRAIFFAGLIYGVIKIPFIVARENQVITERLDLYRQVERKQIHQAVVFVASSTGVIRPMPIGDLLRNDKSYENDVLYARDLGEENNKLMEFYPDRSFYRYTREPDIVEGRLEIIQ